MKTYLILVQVLYLARSEDKRAYFVTTSQGMFFKGEQLNAAALLWMVIQSNFSNKNALCSEMREKSRYKN